MNNDILNVDDSVDNHTIVENIRVFCKDYSKKNKLSQQDMSELIGIPFECYRDFIYGRSNTFRIGNLLLFAKKIDTLVSDICGVSVLSDDLRQILNIAVQLNPRGRKLLKWTAEELLRSCSCDEEKQKTIPYRKVKCENGEHSIGIEFDHLDVTHLKPHIRAKAILAVIYECDCLMPYITPYDILIIASDRPCRAGDVVAVQSSGKFWILQKQDEGYYYLNGIFATKYEDVDIEIGYLCYKMLAQ